MPEITSTKLERKFEVSASALAVEMKNAVIELGEQQPGEKNKRFLERAARAAGISFRSAKSLFYCEAQNPGSLIVDSVRAARDERRRTATAKAVAAAAARDKQLEDQARAKFQRSTAALSATLATAVVSDTDEIRGLLVELIVRLDRLCGVDSAVDRREAA